jgi:hypothetical protein
LAHLFLLFSIESWEDENIIASTESDDDTEL